MATRKNMSDLIKGRRKQYKTTKKKKTSSKPTKKY